MEPSFNLSDAVGGNNQSGPWPNSPQPNQPTWPGQTPPNPVWPGGGNPQSGGMFGNAGTQSGGMFGGGVPQPGGQSGGGFPQPGGQFGGGFPQPGGQSGGGFPQPGGQFGGGFPQPGGQSGGGFPQPGGQPSKPLKVPYSQPLPRGVYDKLLITIRGMPNHNPNKFTVDLHAGRDLAFHLNPRFNENGHKVIVRNSSIGGKWGKEERELRNFPFVPGQPFEMKILCTHSEFKVAVDGSHLFEYKHRITNLRSINQLCIHNDVSLTAVNMETLP